MDDLAVLLAPDPTTGQTTSVQLSRAKVTAVTAAVATLEWAGGTGYGASYLTHSTLVVGDVVAVLHGEGALLVLGKIR